RRARSSFPTRRSSDLEQVEPSNSAALEQAREAVKRDEAEYREAKAVSDHWFDLSRGFGIALALLLLVDAFLMPGIVRRLHAKGEDRKSTRLNSSHLGI